MGGGIGTVVLLLLVMLLGGDPSALLNTAPTQPGLERQAGSGIADEGREFSAVVLADTEEVWTTLFAEIGRTYVKPKLVLFSDRVESACGMASSAVGPFYCGEDQNIYLDLTFFNELSQRFGAPGDFAQAYVIAHEVGHHVQRQLGILDRVHAMRRRLSEREANQMSVRLELQADFFAGVWAHHAQRRFNILDEQDIGEAIRAAEAIGDDRLQRQAQGTVVPDSFTHGSSEQRVRWFMKGWRSGDLNQGDTFSARQL